MNDLSEPRWIGTENQATSTRQLNGTAGVNTISLEVRDSSNQMYQGEVNDLGFHVDIDDTEALVSEERTVGNGEENRDAGLLSRTRSPAVVHIQSSHYGDHCHRPSSGPNNLARNQLIVVSILCLLFMVAEIVGGLLSNSLALVTDATHLACDLAGFLVSLLAIWLANKPASKTMSFGFYRAEVVGATISVLIIWVVTGVLVYLGVRRVLDQSYEIHADEMLIVSSVGVFFNIVMGLVLHSGLCKKCKVHANFGHGHSHGGHTNDPNSHSPDSPSNDDTSNYSINNPNYSSPSSPPAHTNTPDLQQDGSSENRYHNISVILEAAEGIDQYGKTPVEKQNINVRAAMVHVIGDLVQSIGVLIAAIIIKIKPEYKLADPICTFVFSVLVVFTTLTVLRDVLRIFMEGVPRDINYCAMKKDLEALPGVKTAHSLNVWALTADKLAVAVHLAIVPQAHWSSVLKSGTSLLYSKYDAHQSTIQVEEYEEESMTKCQQCLGPP